MEKKIGLVFYNPQEPTGYLKRVLKIEGGYKVNYTRFLSEQDLDDINCLLIGMNLTDPDFQGEVKEVVEKHPELKVAMFDPGKMFYGEIARKNHDSNGAGRRIRGTAPGEDDVAIHGRSPQWLCRG